MATSNNNYHKLAGSYLFSEIAKRTGAFKREFPTREIFHLGIGNTTQPLSPIVIDGLEYGVKKLASSKTYTGYGEEQGNMPLRNELVAFYKKRNVHLLEEEIFISDGAKSDIANIQSIFAANSIVAIQDPVYPVYVDSNVIAGRSGKFSNGTYEGFVYMPCTRENSFFPALPDKKVDLIYICSPNNPTGTVATKQQLREFVTYAKSQKAIIIFDAAYSAFIQDDAIPRSIYEIEGSKECAIEINSFSKYAGFTGVRLGWTVVPKTLMAQNTTEGELNFLWNRRQTTMFNGASNIAQEGGIAALSDKGQQQCQKIIHIYMKNAEIIGNCFRNLGFDVFGGIHAPYIWLKTPKNLSSWEFFDILLQKAGVVSTPGVGFGLHGEGYMRFSSFGNPEMVRKATKQIAKTISI